MTTDTGMTKLLSLFESGKSRKDNIDVSERLTSFGHIKVTFGLSLGLIRDTHTMKYKE